MTDPGLAFRKAKDPRKLAYKLNMMPAWRIRLRHNPDLTDQTRKIPVATGRVDGLCSASASRSISTQYRSPKDGWSRRAGSEGVSAIILVSSALRPSSASLFAFIDG
ncbi:hypothetical protein FLP41_15860 [Paracoccus marcusii]|uniref:hypothetical protein n=1 Tax=Paracoccus marcusii TaxID=59779 RepID=UPI002ED53DCE|nr:hypothetical protein FLP41_15860 [Paracoccus marcusii]